MMGRTEKMTWEKERTFSEKPMLRDQQAVRAEKKPEERNYLSADIKDMDEEEDDYW